MRAVIADTDDAIGPVGLVAGRVFRPVLPGEIAAITASGFGPTDPPLDPGAMASGPGALLLPVVVVIGDYTLAPEEVNLAIKVKVGDAISPEAATLNGGAPQWGFPSVKLTRRNRWPLGATGPYGTEVAVTQVFCRRVGWRSLGCSAATGLGWGPGQSAP